MQSQLDERGLRRFEMGAEFVHIGDKIVCSAHWLDADGRRTKRYQVLTIRGGEIADMQVCGTWRQAKRFAKRMVA